MAPLQTAEARVAGLVDARIPGSGHRSPLPPVAAALVGTYADHRGLADPMLPFWVAQLPHHREELLARDYFEPRMSQRGWLRDLPLVAESDGPAGYSVHLAVAFGLLWQVETEEVVDALLVLAARKQLDTGLLERQLEALLNYGWPSANKASDSLRTAAETGAYATVGPYSRPPCPACCATLRSGARANCSHSPWSARPDVGPKERSPRSRHWPNARDRAEAVKNARSLRDVLR